MILEKIEPSILNGLGYIGRLEKKNGNNLWLKLRIFAVFDFLLIPLYALVQLTRQKVSSYKNSSIFPNKLYIEGQKFCDLRLSHQIFQRNLAE